MIAVLMVAALLGGELSAGAVNTTDDPIHASSNAQVLQKYAGIQLNSNFALAEADGKNPSLVSVEHSDEDGEQSRESTSVHRDSIDIPAWITGLFTIVLAVVTGVLAHLTGLLAKRTSQPQVVANLEPNLWSIRHLDLIVTNTGNATAFDVRVKFDPPLPDFKDVPQREGEPALSSISVVRPGQLIRSSQCEFDSALEHSRIVSVSWKKNPKDKKTELLTYNLDLSGIVNYSQLGHERPEVQISNDIKKIREILMGVLSHGKRLNVDVFSSTDRKEERQRQQERMNELRSQTDR